MIKGLEHCGLALKKQLYKYYQKKFCNLCLDSQLVLEVSFNKTSEQFEKGNKFDSLENRNC